MKRVLRSAFVLLCVAAVSHAQTTAAITADDFRQRITIFAHDSMQGRMTGTRGNVRATEYLVRELTRIGAKAAGDNYKFYQDVPIEPVKVDVKNAELATSGVRLKPGIDFLPIVGQFGVAFPASAVSPPGLRKNTLKFGGTWSDTVGFEFIARHRSDSAWRAGSDLSMHVLGPPMRPDGKPDYQFWNSSDLLEQYRGVSAVFVESLDLTPRSVLAKFASQGFMLRAENSQVQTNPTTGLKMQKKVELPPLPPVVAITPSAAGMLRVAPRGLVSLRFTSTIGFLDAPARNVVAMIEGSGPLKSEVVVLSAHADHRGIAGPAEREGRDSIMNGADVSGSGSMALLEIAEYIASQREKPKRSIVFLWTVGEEQGMLGSQWFVAHTTEWLGTVVANINVDAIGRGGANDVPGGGPDYVQVRGANVLSTEYAGWINDMIGRPDIGLKPVEPITIHNLAATASCGGDHRSFTRAGIPSVFITTGLHADTRAVTDEAQRLDYEKTAKVAQFVAALALDVAGRPARPVLDPRLAVALPCGG